MWNTSQYIAIYGPDILENIGIRTPRSILFSQPLGECELLARDDDEEVGR